MKKLRVFLLLSALIFVLLFAVPQYLIRQEIAAAQDDLARLAVKPAPAQTAGGDALWLVGYRAETAAERERMMATHRPLLMRGSRPPALAEYELPQPENGEFTCGSGKSAADCLAEIRGNLPQYRDQAEKYRELLANIDRLADYDAFAQSGWPNDHTGSSDIALPRLQHLFLSVPTAALDWADGRQQAALVRVCRSLKTGRTLLQGRPNMLYPMVGNALIQKHTALAAQMLAEDPSWAKRLPKECDGAFAVLSPQEQNLCTAVQDEFHASANLLRKMSPEWSPRKMFTVMALAANMSDEDSIGSLRVPRWMIWVPVMDIEHSRARSAAYYAQGCNAETAAARPSKLETALGLQQQRPGLRALRYCAHFLGQLFPTCAGQRHAAARLSGCPGALPSSRRRAPRRNRPHFGRTFQPVAPAGVERTKQQHRL